MQSVHADLPGGKIEDGRPQGRAATWWSGLVDYGQPRMTAAAHISTELHFCLSSIHLPQVMLPSLVLARASI
jgi:hypothetical protein